jgi:hypothetical protein
MKALLLFVIALSLAVLSAHFLRYGNVIGFAASLALVALLFVRRTWVARLIQTALVLGALEWMHTLYVLVQFRLAQGAPTARMAAIIGVVIVTTLVSAALFQTRTLQQMYGLGKRDKAAGSN